VILRNARILIKIFKFNQTDEFIEQSAVKMNKQIFLKWLKLNVTLFSGAFLLTFIIVQLFPVQMVALEKGWANLISETHPGLKQVSEYGSELELFGYILVWNSVSLLICFIVCLLITSPVISPFLGFFYGTVLFTGPLRGHVLTTKDLIFIPIKVSFFIITITFASALGTEIFGIKPERKPLINYFKKSFTRLWYIPKPERNWRDAFAENKKEFMLFAVTIAVLLLLGAWFEVYG